MYDGKTKKKKEKNAPKLKRSKLIVPFWCFYFLCLLSVVAVFALRCIVMKTATSISKATSNTPNATVFGTPTSRTAAFKPPKPTRRESR